ncbi:wall-associated receptor kinase-like 17 [Spinacia oleracea]|uniref:Wall-associated receptor kinase-like 17 n=1 Tax=Spinacia oleracea TaxID=3562 RepID=A0ABM3QJ59_SPIOL|nr:wall-associated receptor kinase-like 17 [Spinacia oleracea]
MGQAQTKRNKNKNKKNPKFDSLEEYFIKNGGILLEKQIALSQGQHKGAGQLKIFSSKDITKATNNYDPDLIVGRNSHHTVYKTTIEDRMVAIQAPSKRESNPELIDLTLTEACTVMVMNHDNMVKLYGCCLETFVPIPVYEFLNTDLFHHLHGDTASSKCIKWADRLRVATDTAYALSYMHNALAKPVVHRDVNSSSVLLDFSCNAKLANFAYSVSITPGEKPQRWPIEGTPGYIDPEYVETHEVTDKCDVYSFGVLLLELLTRRSPCLMMARGGTDLVGLVVSMVERNCLIEMVDSEVLEQASLDEIEQVAKLAMICVAKKGVERPTMVEVVTRLWQIKGRELN